MEVILFVIGLVVVIYVISWIAKLNEKAKLYEELKPRLDNLTKNEEIFNQEQTRWIQKVEHEKDKWNKKVEADKNALLIIAKEKSIGFPWLAQAYADFYHLQDLQIADAMEFKSHPARKSADTVRNIAQARRNTEKHWRVLNYQINYYESLFPWLTEFKDEEIDDLILQINKDNENVDNEDPAKRWLTTAEYSSLSPSERNQIALNRYWQKKKSKWEIGRDFERYIGYQYENKGWQVRYQGIVEGYDDLGRDLIATKGNAIQVVQCKYWSQYKTIHEKHIFQLYGTVFAYQLDNPQKHVSGVFVTSTKLSDTAILYALKLNISMKEGITLKSYPCIKCNVSSRSGEKIYHLPFDQQYDRTIINGERNEYYVSTIREAEDLGFRRAYKWKGMNG